MITVVVGKEIEKIKGDFESYLNGLNMVGEISYPQYSKLYDEGTKQIQKAYELGKAELEEENERLKGDLELWESGACRATNLDKCGVVKELEEQIEKMKRDVIAESDKAERLEDVITYIVLNDILEKWGIKEK